MNKIKNGSDNITINQNFYNIMVNLKNNSDNLVKININNKKYILKFYKTDTEKNLILFDVKGISDNEVTIAVSRDKNTYKIYLFNSIEKGLIKNFIEDIIDKQSKPEFQRNIKDTKNFCR